MYTCPVLCHPEDRQCVTHLYIIMLKNEQGIHQRPKIRFVTECVGSALALTSSGPQEVTDSLNLALPAEVRASSQEEKENRKEGKKQEKERSQKGTGLRLVQEPCDGQSHGGLVDIRAGLLALPYSPCCSSFQSALLLSKTLSSTFYSST